MKSALIKIGICILLGIGTISLLYGVSDRLTRHNNSFNRLLPAHAVVKIKAYDLKVNSFYVAGSHENKVYIGNRTIPLHLLQVDLTKTDTSSYKLFVENREFLKFRKIPKVRTLYPSVYIMDGFTPKILRGSMESTMIDTLVDDNIYFSEAVPISHKSFAIRAISSQTGRYVLGKLHSGPPQLDLKYGLLGKQTDGLFANDGILLFNKERKRLIYIYYYRNLYLVMDDDLNYISIGNTIDTNSVAKVKSTYLKSHDSRKMTAPPILVNKYSAVYGNRLFVNSALQADNEDKESFQGTSVIDVYDFKKDQYLFSFYVPKYKNYRITGFTVTKNHLIALHKNYLVIYKKSTVFNQF